MHTNVYIPQNVRAKLQAMSRASGRGDQLLITTPMVYIDINIYGPQKVRTKLWAMSQARRRRHQISISILIDWFWLQSRLIHNRALCTRIALFMTRYNWHSESLWFSTNSHLAQKIGSQNQSIVYLLTKIDVPQNTRARCEQEHTQSNYFHPQLLFVSTPIFTYLRMSELGTEQDRRGDQSIVSSDCLYRTNIDVPQNVRDRHRATSQYI